jgi:hypothetical protein
MTFLGLRPSEAPALVEAASGERVSYAELLDAASRSGATLGDAGRLVALLTRNDRFSCTVYAATQVSGHVAAMLDGSKPIAAHVDVLRAYQPDWIAGPPGTAIALREAGLDVDRVVEAHGGELVAMAGPGGPSLHPALAVLLAPPAARAAPSTSVSAEPTWRPTRAPSPPTSS